MKNLDFAYLHHFIAPCSGPGRISARALSYAVIACAKANEVREAFNLIGLYRDDSSDNPQNEVITIAAVNSLIGALSRAQMPDKAVQLLNDMQKEYGVTPDVKSYRLAIIACNQAEHREAKCAKLSGSSDCIDFTWWQCAVSLLRRMLESGLEPDSQTYSSIVSALESGKSKNSFFKLMPIIFEIITLVSHPFDLKLDNGREQ